MKKLYSHNTFQEVKSISYWIWLLIAPASILMWVGMYIQLIRGKPFGAKPANDITLIILWITFGVILPFLFYLMKYKIELNSELLLLGFLPFYKRMIALEEIESINVVAINPLIDFGGWGLRFNGKKTGLIIKGNTGVEIKLKNNKIYVIANQRSEELYKQQNLLVKQ